MASAPEEGILAAPWAAVGVGTVVVTVVVLTAVVVVALAPMLLSYRENVTYMSNVQREIFTRGGSYPGMSSDLRRFWAPGPEEQERLDHLLNLNAPPVTSAGTAADDVAGTAAHYIDDQTTIDDYKAMIGPSRPSLDKTARPGSQSLPPNNSGGNYSVHTSDELDAAALQRQRIQAIQNGDMNGYNNLLPLSARI